MECIMLTYYFIDIREQKRICTLKQSQIRELLLAMTITDNISHITDNIIDNQMIDNKSQTTSSLSSNCGHKHLCLPLKKKGCICICVCWLQNH